MEDDFQPTKEDTFALIGGLLITTQDTEDAISWALRVVFKDGILTAEDFVRKDKKTLGGLVTELRQRMELEESFEGLLLAFVEQRNLFVHNLRKQSWFDLETEKGINDVWSALGRYLFNMEQVVLTFSAYSLRFAEMIGVPWDHNWQRVEESGFLPHLREEYYPKLGHAVKGRKNR